MPRSHPTPLLFIVHPGSACGSADMNLGRDNAAQQRLEMQMLVEGWEGGVVVIDGDLSEELEEGYGRSAWRDWGVAVEEAVKRAKQANLLSLRIRGDDGEQFNQEAAARQVVADHQLSPEEVSMTLTGAWVEDNGSGCVNSVRDVLIELGFTPQVSDAMDLDFPTHGEDNDSEMEGDDEVAQAPIAVSAPAKTRAPGRK